MWRPDQSGGENFHLQLAWLSAVAARKINHQPDSEASLGDFLTSHVNEGSGNGTSHGREDASKKWQANKRINKH
jgi:hypothetical protein